MSGIKSLLKRAFGMERVGDLQLNYLSVLVYLEVKPRQDRATSAEKLGEVLGIAENTVMSAFHKLLDFKYISLAPDELQSNPYEMRDPRSFVVTPLGRMALKPFLGAFGYVTVAVLTVFALAFGAMLGAVIFSLFLYPSYALALAIVSVPLFAVMVFALYTLVRDERNRRRAIVSIALRKKQTQTSLDE